MRHEAGHRYARVIDVALATACVLAGTLAGVGGAALATGAGIAGAAGIVPPANPSANIPFEVVPDCTTGPTPDNSAGCISSLLTDIDHARSLEGVGPMSLPSGFATIPTDEQLWVVLNLERRDRGVPVVTQLDGTLSAASGAGAAEEVDPSPPPGYPALFSTGGIVAWGQANVLYADYEWMYDDGPNGVNVDCTSANSSGCWAHRDNILGDYSSLGTPVMGTGSATVSAGCAGPCPAYAALLGDSSQAAQNPLYTWSSVFPAASGTGYDLVGADGGVFVLPVGESGGFYGSLPGLKVAVDDIVGMVPSNDDQGYFLVGADGGVFSFGDTHFEGSLPGLNVHVNDIVGIVPTTDDEGYFLVGADGGVFSFGDSSFEGSLPAEGIHVDDVVGIAATADDRGYWVVASTGQVYSFGDAAGHGSATGLGAPATGIAATADAGGYWVVASNGNVAAFGDAANEGSLPALHVTPARPVVALVPTRDDGGYWLIGSDGGVFSFGDAPNVGSLPGLGVHVDNVVGAVPTDVG